MSTQIKLFEMNEDRYKVACPFYGEKDYAFTFEFTAVNAVWQGHDADSVSLVAKPNIWMGEEKEDYYTVESRQVVAGERAFSYRQGRSFTLVCLDDQLCLMLRVWEEDKEGRVLSASRRNKSAMKVATRMTSGRSEPLVFSHDDPCLIKLETKGGVSTVKVWNTREGGEAPFILGDFGESFNDFFSGFTEFQFNTIPLAIKNGRHSLQLERVAAWVGNSLPEGENNFRDYLGAKKPVLKCFAYRQLPLERLSAYYPFHKDRWAVLDHRFFYSMDNVRFEIGAAQGLHFDAAQNKCSMSLRPSGRQGVSSSFMLGISLKEPRLSKITTVAEQLDEWSKAQVLFSNRRHGLNFKAILEDIEAFDPAKPLVLSPHYKDGTLAGIIKAGALADKLPSFMALLENSSFDAKGSGVGGESQIKKTIGDLQAKLNEDKEKLYVHRENFAVLTFKTTAPKRVIAFNIQVLRRMRSDSRTEALNYDEKIVFKDDQDNEHGAIDLTGFPGVLLLSLSDDRKTFSVFFARPDSDLSAPLIATFTYKVFDDIGQASPQKNQTMDEVTLALGLGRSSLDSPVMISIKDLTLWDTALWRREGLLTSGDKVDEDYNVKTLAHLSFSGALNPLIARYKQSLKV